MKKSVFLLFVFPFIFSCEKDVAQDEELNSFSASEKVDYTYEEFSRLSVCEKLTFGTWVLKEDSLSVNQNPDRNLDRCITHGYYMWKPIFDSVRIEGDGKMYFDSKAGTIDSSFTCSSEEFYSTFPHFKFCTVNSFVEWKLVNDTTLQFHGMSPVFENVKNPDWSLYQVEVFGSLVLRSDNLEN